MLQKAIYVGKRKLLFEERIGEDGKKIPAFDGTEYVFCFIERGKDDEIKSNFGYTLSDRRKKGELINDIEDGIVNVGDMCYIDFDLYNLTQKRFICRYGE